MFCNIIMLYINRKFNTLCQCGGPNCTLAESKDENGNVVDYTCVYPIPPTPEVPLQATISLSSKSVPQRYFDTSGVTHETYNSTTTAQEGTAFEYTSSNDKVRYKNHELPPSLQVPAWAAAIVFFLGGLSLIMRRKR